MADKVRTYVDWSPEIEGILLERIAMGETVKAIGDDPEMPGEWSIHNHRRTDPRFAVLYKDAREEQMRSWADEIISLADNAREDWVVVGGTADNPVLKLNREHIARTKERIDTRKWLMARILASEFGDKSTVDVNHNIKSMDDEELWARIRDLLEQFGMPADTITLLLDLIAGR